MKLDTVTGKHTLAAKEQETLSKAIGLFEAVRDYGPMPMRKVAAELANSSIALDKYMSPSDAPLIDDLHEEDGK